MQKMGLVYLVLQLLLLFTVHEIVAQPEGSDCAYVRGLLADEQAADRFFEVLRDFESEGDLCKVNRTNNKIGPYQISKEYYDVAVSFNQDLESGKIWNNVWGNLSDDYSRRIIRNYLCQTEINIKTRRNLQQLTIRSIAAMHRGGVNIRQEVQFGRMVQNRYRSTADPFSISSESCDPPCKAGQCCRNNICYCLNSATLEEYVCEVEECEPQQIEGLDIVFVLDASGSIREPNFVSMINAVVNIVNSLTIGPNKTRVAVVRFSSSATLMFNLNTYTQKSTLIQAIRGISYTGGGTNTHQALALLRTSIFSEVLGVRSDFEATKVAIVITDGRSSNPSETKTQADLLRSDENFLIYAIGVGSGVGVTELNNIAGSSSTVLQLQDFRVAELQRLQERIVEDACFIAPPPQLDENTEIDRTLGQGTVTHYQVQIPEDGLTFMIDLEEGKVLVCGSRSNRRPDCRDPSTYEWQCETRDYCDIHVKSGTSRRRRQTNNDIMFVSIEGVDESNEVKLQVMMGDETISNVASPITLTDTVINLDDPLYEVPVTHTPPGMDPTTTSLCFQVHGESGNYYNLISDDCIQVNVLYDAMKNSSNGNFIKEIGIVTRDTAKNCSEIRMRANRCVPVIDNEAFNESYNENGITIVKNRKRSYEITVPNCKATQADDISFEITCVKIQGQKTIRFDVRRGGGLKPGAHGLIGQFWNIPVDVLEYTGNYSGPVNNTYVVTVNPPNPASTSRTFIAELHPATWDGKRKQCLYVGSAQSGAINEVDVPNDHVIEGTYDNYETSDLFASDFQYNQFKEDQCA